MEKTIEQKLVLTVPDGVKITRVKIADDGKNVEVNIVSEVVEKQQSVPVNLDNFDEVFPIIDPSELIGHKLLSHKPRTERQEILLANICRSIELRMPAFRAPSLDPSEENGEIIFKPGSKPAVGHPSDWWREKWKRFMPSKNSRSGTELHWAAFMGKLMKYLVEEKNYSVEDAWKAVCDDSVDLGHYWNSKDAKHYFEPTGSRKVGLFCDLGNTSKILEKWDDSGSFFAGGTYYRSSNYYPLAALDTIGSLCKYYDDSVGWLVLDV